MFIDTAAIEGSAFANCAALKTFTLLEGSISSPCFSGCTSLESVVLGDESAALGMYDEFGNLLDEGFEYEILRGVSSIPSNAFQSLPALRRVVLYGSLTEVPYGAFQSDVALEEVKLSPAITRIASYAFSGDSALHSMAFSDNLTQIDSYAFQNCTSFDALTLPGQMTSVSSYAFYGCGLESITFTGTVQTIGSYAFAQNAGLVEIQIPDGVVTISDHAFDGCAALERAYIPNSVQTVGASAFPATTRVYCDPSSQAARSISQNGGSFVSPDNETFGIRLLLDGEFSLGLSVEQVWTDESAIVIPEYIGGEMVTEVGASTFTSCPTVTEVTFPASVQEIPAGLCKDNDRLVKVNLPEGVTRIREGAFQNCAHLADVSFPSTLTIIEKDAFAGCPLLVEARLSDNIQQIGENAFPNTKVYCRLNSDTARMLSRTGGSFICEEYPLLKLKYLMDGTVVKSLGVVGSEAAETIIVPEGVTSIAAEAFKDNVTLKNITLPDSLTSIGAYAFAGSGVVNVTLPAGVREIPDYAFYNAASLTSLTLKDEGVITSIGAHAFDGSGVTSLAFPEGLQTVGAAAFANTPRLSACDLPDSVTALGSAESWTEADGVFYNAAALTSFTVPAGVTEITNSAFAKTSALTSVTIPEGVTKVGSYAFKESHLASVTLPFTVKEVHYGAFQDCIDLKRVSMSGDMDTMGGYVFSGCINLESVTMPDTLRTMESYVFQNCKKLTDITLPDGLNTIYGNTFDGCTRLGHVKVGDGTVVIDNYAFQSCSALTSVELPASLRKIGRQAFSSTGLTSIAIPDGVTTIEEYAFSNCSALTSVILPDSVVSLGRGAFQSCNNLTEVRLPAGISLLPEYLLYNTKITSVTVPDGVRSISDSAFSDCYQLKSILIPASVESIGDDALRNISPSQVTVYCYVGTEADAFAQNKGYQIVYLDGSQALNGLTIEPSGATELSMGLGHTLNDIDALFCVKPDGAPYLPAMAFSVSDEAVAQVDGTDLTGLTVGQVTLTASFVDNPAITSSVTVHVRENVTDYALTDPIWQKKDEPLTLMPESTVPAGANDGYVWEIDRALGTIEGNVLTPTAFGKGTLSATSWNGLKRSATIYIYEDPTEIWFTGVPAGMDIGGTTDLNLYVKAGAVFTGEEALHFVTYSSSDESIATVDQAGHVTATGYGDAVITAEAGNGVKGTCDIHVSKPITSFRLKQDIYAPIGSVVELYAVDIEPADANPNAFSWECTPAGLVEYENGRITVLTEQECEVTITATAWNNPNVRQTTNLNIYRPVVEEITIEPVNAWNYVPVNSEVQLTAHVKATTMFENQLVTWSIVNPEQWSTYNRPTVDSKGLLDVSRMSSGWGDRVTVRATADNGVYDELTLRVYYPIETFELPERYTIQTGETVTVTPTKAYNNSTGETDLMNYCPAFTMSVTGSHLAEIDGMTLTGLQPGETELTVTSWNGTSRTVHVLVYNPIETVEVYTVESKNGRYSLSDPMRDLFAQMNYRAHSKAISDKTYTDDLVTWTSSDSTVIRVDNPVTGEFRTLKYGTAILTATAANGVVGQIELNVRVQVDTFTAPELIEAPVMADTILTVDAYAPENAYDGFVWRLQEAGYGYIEGNILHVTADTPVDGLHLYVSDWNGYNLNKEVILNIVRMPVTDVTLDALPGDEIGVGGDYQLTAHVKAGADYVNKFVTWASSDETVATVSPEGVVHALAAGEVTITATAINTDEDGQPIAASLTLTSVQGVDSFAVSPEEITLFMGESTELTISDIQPEDATVREFAYSVEPEGIATVEDGVLTPSITESVEGTLTVTSWNGTGVQVPLHLIYPTIEKVETEPIEGMFLNETADLVAHVTVNGVEYINRFVTWSTDGAVTVDESGLITPQYKGTAHIYLADALTGERLETLTFDVTQPLQDFGVRLNDSYIEIGDVNVHNFNVENMTPDDADYDFEYAIAGGGEITGTDVMSYEDFL